MGTAPIAEGRPRNLGLWKGENCMCKERGDRKENATVGEGRGKNIAMFSHEEDAGLKKKGGRKTTIRGNWVPTKKKKNTTGTRGVHVRSTGDNSLTIAWKKRRKHGKPGLLEPGPQGKTSKEK